MKNQSNNFTEANKTKQSLYEQGGEQGDIQVAHMTQKSSDEATDVPASTAENLTSSTYVTACGLHIADEEGEELEF